MNTKEQIRVLREYQYGGGDGQTHFGPHSFDLTNGTVDAIIKALGFPIGWTEVKR